MEHHAQSVAVGKEIGAAASWKWGGTVEDATAGPGTNAGCVSDRQTDRRETRAEGKRQGRVAAHF